MTKKYPPVKDFFLIGKTLKSHGTAGQLRLMMEDKFKTYLRAGSFVFLDLDGSKVPFQITGYEEGAHIVISFDQVDAKQESDKLSGKEIWIPIEQAKTQHLNSPRNLDEKWEGFQIADQKSLKSYRLLRTEEYPQQLMAVIENNGKEILIPLHEQLIQSIDRDQKVIHMEIPEGLLDL